MLNTLSQPNLIKLLKKIITNVLTALYQPFWFAVILTVFLLFFYLYAYKPIDTGKGIRAAFRAWWQEFRTSLLFRKLFLLTFFTVMILFQTLSTEICGSIRCRILWEAGGSGTRRQTARSHWRRNALKISYWCFRLWHCFCGQWQKKYFAAER